MSRRHNQVSFKPYVMNQDNLLPPRLDELIPEHHLVRVVNRAIEQIKLAPPCSPSTRAEGPPAFIPR